jgi:hypothetical protein
VLSKRFCERQQMQWIKRAAHLPLQMRVKALNHERRAVFRHWYPNFPVEEEEEPWAAKPPHLYAPFATPRRCAGRQ